MKAKKLYINSIQKLSFKAFAIIAFVLLFIVSRIPLIKIFELEFSGVSDSFSVSGIGFGKAAKFFDYFGVAVPSQFEFVTYLAFAILVLGLASLVMSFFGYRIVQVTNVVVSFVGFVLSVVFGVIITVFSVGFGQSELGGIMTVSINYVLVWLPAVLFLVGTNFVYVYAKMPGYSLAEGRFWSAYTAAVNPARFVSTFTSNDTTEQMFRSRVPLKKKKYATISEPKAIKKAKHAKRKADKKGGVDSAKPKPKLTSLEIALKRREHAEKVANNRADEENRAMYRSGSFKNSPKHTSAKTPPRHRAGTASANKSLELAKRRAEHAENVAARSDDIYC